MIWLEDSIKEGQKLFHYIRRDDGVGLSHLGGGKTLNSVQRRIDEWIRISLL